MSKPDASGESVLEEILDELFAAALKQESGEGEENNSSDVEKRVLEVLIDNNSLLFSNLTFP